MQRPRWTQKAAFTNCRLAAEAKSRRIFTAVYSLPLSYTQAYRKRRAITVDFSPERVSKTRFQSVEKEKELQITLLKSTTGSGFETRIRPFDVKICKIFALYFRDGQTKLLIYIRTYSLRKAYKCLKSLAAFLLRKICRLVNGLLLDKVRT